MEPGWQHDSTLVLQMRWFATSDGKRFDLYLGHIKVGAVQNNDGVWPGYGSGNFRLAFATDNALDARSALRDSICMQLGVGSDKN